MIAIGRRGLVLGLFAGAVLPVTNARAEADAGSADAGDARERLEGARLDALLEEVARARKAVRTLRASFTQERRLRLLATTVASKGQLTFVAPDRLRWELAPPDDVVYWVGPEGLAYRTRSAKASVPSAGAKVAQALGDVRALLGGDIGPLRERFVLGAARGRRDVEISGAARQTGTSVRAFTLVLDKELVLPRRARLVEGKADTIDLVFANAAANVPVDPATMRP